MPPTPAIAALCARQTGGAVASNRSRARNFNLNRNARPPQAGD